MLTLYTRNITILRTSTHKRRRRRLIHSLQPLFISLHKPLAHYPRQLGAAALLLTRRRRFISPHAPSQPTRGVMSLVLTEDHRSRTSPSFSGRS